MRFVFVVIGFLVSLSTPLFAQGGADGRVSLGGVAADALTTGYIFW